MGHLGESIEEDVAMAERTARTWFITGAGGAFVEAALAAGDQVVARALDDLRIGG